MRSLRVMLLTVVVLFLSAFGCGNGAAGGDDGGGGPTVPTFDGARAFADLAAQVAFGPRAPGTTAHETCRQWLVETLSSLSPDVTEQPFTYHAATGADYSFANVIAVFEPTAGRLTDQTLLLGAHWDTRPIAERDPDPKRRSDPIPGANDGASGVAILLELARAFHAVPPPRRVVLVCFDFEDGGLTELTTGEPLSGFSIGARRFAENLGRWRPDEAIVLDMVGDAHLQLPQEQNSLASNPTLVDEVWGVARRLLFSQFEDRPGPTITDDHLPLIQLGVPSIDLIDFDYPGPNDHSYWHTHQDTVEHCSAESLRAVGQTLLALIYGGG